MPGGCMPTGDGHQAAGRVSSPRAGPPGPGSPSSGRPGTWAAGTPAAGSRVFNNPSSSSSCRDTRSRRAQTCSEHAVDAVSRWNIGDRSVGIPAGAGSHTAPRRRRSRVTTGGRNRSPRWRPVPAGHLGCSRAVPVSRCLPASPGPRSPFPLAGPGLAGARRSKSCAGRRRPHGRTDAIPSLGWPSAARRAVWTRQRRCRALGRVPARAPTSQQTRLMGPRGARARLRSGRCSALAPR